jgi:type I restriction enzyme R subunit
MPNPAPGKFTEQELESAIIELFKDEGYSHVHGETIHRKYDDILLEDDLRTFLNGYYKTAALTESETAKIITQIKLIPSYPLYEGNKTAFTLFRVCL